MTPENVSEAMKKIVTKYAPKTEGGLSLTNESRLDELGIDSPRRIDILLDTEDQFDISIEDQQFESVYTFGDLVGLVSSMIAARAS